MRVIGQIETPLRKWFAAIYLLVGTKHLDRYLEELEWRFNNRANPHIFRDTLRRSVNTDTPTYKRLTAA